MGIGREMNKKAHARNAVAKGMDEWESEQEELVMSKRETDLENELDGEYEETRAKRGRQNMTIGELEDYCHALREMDYKRPQRPLSDWFDDEVLEGAYFEKD
ncbi:MAG: hypothetical protein E6R04_01240 [Spirochaetes bacterium]|nr:MAG: hypothetical protein E6R04_01240 [Spirochaetota bacterium]